LENWFSAIFSIQSASSHSHLLYHEFGDSGKIRKAVLAPQVRQFANLPLTQLFILFHFANSLAKKLANYSMGGLRTLAVTGNSDNAASQRLKAVCSRREGLH
jgi:hypothetical protein